MALNFFFSEPSLLQEQAQDKTFGPIQGNLDTRFRVCSLHSASSNPKAIAINNGYVAVQKITGSSSGLLNLILRPISQGNIDGFRIKYFIYRGILEESLLNGDEIAAASKNDLTQALWENQNAHNAQTGDSGNPPDDLLGVQYQSLPDTDSLDKLFFDKDSEFVTPPVKAGEYIGDFDKNEFGIQVVVENYYSDFNLGKVRTLDHTINVSSYPTTGTDKEKYENKALRETVLSYIDPASFYGLNFFEGVSVVKTSGEPDTFKEDDIYEHLLYDTANSKKIFYNYDVLYIDFRNDKGVSRNFYKEDFKYDLTEFIFNGENNDSTETLGTNYWPLLIVRSDMHNNAEALNGQKVSGLKFSYPIHDHTATSAFFLASGGKWNSNSEELTKKTMNKSRIILQDQGIFSTSITPLITVINNFSIAIPYNTISNYIGAYYLKLYSFEKNHSGSISANTLVTVDPLDNLYAFPKEEKSVSAGQLYIHKTGHLKYVDLEVDNVKAVFELGIAWEEHRVIFFAFPIAIESSTSGTYIPASFDENWYSVSSFYKFIENFLKGIKIAKHQLSLNSGNVEVLQFEEKLFTDYWQVSEQDLISLVISRTEFQNLQTVINSNSLDINLHPLFLNGTIDSDTDNNDQAYYQAQLKLAGFQNSASDFGIVNINPPNSTVEDAYSVDKYTFATDSAVDEESVGVTPISEFAEILYTSDLITALSNVGKSQVTNALDQMETFKAKAKKICQAAHALKLKFGADNLSENVLGVTHPPGSLPNLPNDTIQINIDLGFIETGTEICIVHTIMHELLHGYISFMLVFYGKSKNDVPGLYDFFNRFGNDDSKPERGWQHNYMAAIQRNEIVEALKEFDEVTNQTQLSGTVYFENIFQENAHDSYDYTGEDIYQALSWQGLARTLVWRQLAEKNHKKMQGYITINHFEINEVQGSNTPFPDYSYYLHISDAFNSDDFQTLYVDIHDYNP